MPLIVLGKAAKSTSNPVLLTGSLGIEGCEMKSLTFLYDKCNYIYKVLEVFVSTRKATKTFSFVAFLF